MKEVFPMIKLLVGEAGSGKSKVMIKMANDSVENQKGEIVYIESNSKHMHQLHRNIRFISTEDFNLSTFNSIYGFLCGIISENYDIQKIFIDGLDKIVVPMNSNIEEFLTELNRMTNIHEVDLLISSSLPSPDFAEKFADYLFDEE